MQQSMSHPSQYLINRIPKLSSTSSIFCLDSVTESPKFHHIASHSLFISSLSFLLHYTDTHGCLLFARSPDLGLSRSSHGKLILPFFPKWVGVRFSAQVLTTAEGHTMVWRVDANHVVRKRELGSTGGYLLYLYMLNYWDHMLNELNEWMRINGKRYVAFVWVRMAPDPYSWALKRRFRISLAYL